MIFSLTCLENNWFPTIGSLEDYCDARNEHHHPITRFGFIRWNMIHHIISKIDSNFLNILFCGVGMRFQTTACCSFYNQNRKPPLIVLCPTMTFETQKPQTFENGRLVAAPRAVLETVPQGGQRLREWNSKQKPAFQSPEPKNARFPKLGRGYFNLQQRM